MQGYPFKSIETRWRNRWEENGVHQVDLKDRSRDKKYVLVMFSYPSDKKLHIGHWWNYSGADIHARFSRMKGFNVFEPMGFDAFGLPAENFAIKHGVHPAIITEESIEYIREQLEVVGAMYDWDKEVNTSRPEYYKWTQWLFLQLYKHGAAYRSEAPVNWCSKCQTVLANEQVLADGSCERCGSRTETRDLEQWFFKITDFADNLLEGLEKIEWPEATKTMQRHWIGRSEGTEIVFGIDGHDEKLKCFTTRPDTLFGVTYVVLAPEHKLVGKIATAEQADAVNVYIKNARNLSDIERLAADREKTGEFTGAFAINPANGEKIPIWIADYVLASYGTGAVMAVPAHDQRDFEFSRKYDLPLKWVIRPENRHDTVLVDRAFEEYGVMHDSGKFDGLSSDEGKKEVTRWLASEGVGDFAVSYRLRDWLISRQRYWGAPIPVIHCDKCGLVPVPEEDLPVLLPMEGVDFNPKGTSPLGSCEAFINVKCPKCGSDAKRDADTMDTFVCSSWYYLRYLSTHLHDKPFDEENVRNWMPVDIYVGGPEHATGHLIYARYITKFLNSIGAIDFDEPFKKLIHQGIITYNGQRMSKSKGNVVNPDIFIDKYGSDCFRLYIMFMGDFTTGGDWSDEGIIGIRRFQNRIWRLFKDWKDRINGEIPESGEKDPEIDRLLNYAIKEVTHDLNNFQFNTAISRLMELINALYHYTSKPEQVNIAHLKEIFEKFNLLLGPLAPSMGEALWEMNGGKGSLFEQSWPTWHEQALVEDSVTVVVQVNGKLVERLELPKSSNEDTVKAAAFEKKKVSNRIKGKEVRKVIFVKDKILNIVV